MRPPSEEEELWVLRKENYRLITLIGKSIGLTINVIVHRNCDICKLQCKLTDDWIQSLCRWPAADSTLSDQSNVCPTERQHLLRENWSKISKISLQRGTWHRDLDAWFICFRCKDLHSRYKSDIWPLFPGNERLSGSKSRTRATSTTSTVLVRLIPASFLICTSGKEYHSQAGSSIAS